MTNQTSSQTNSYAQVLVAGGGIGGIAAALALVRQGFNVKVLEQAAQLGEIGAGLQVGPNGFAAFDALGIGEFARARAVYTDEMVMFDALDESAVGRIPTGDAFFKRFGNPYAVIHRADAHGALLAGALKSPRQPKCSGLSKTRAASLCLTPRARRITVWRSSRPTA
jgi:3-hydroxybenzoate 6-monooxygenase